MRLPYLISPEYTSHSCSTNSYASQECDLYIECMEIEMCARTCFHALRCSHGYEDELHCKIQAENSSSDIKTWCLQLALSLRTWCLQLALSLRTWCLQTALSSFSLPRRQVTSLPVIITVYCMLVTRRNIFSSLNQF